MTERTPLDAESTEEVYENIEKIILEKQELEQKLEEVKEVVDRPSNRPDIRLSVDSDESEGENQFSAIADRYHLRSETDELRSETDELRSETDELRSETDELRSETDELASSIENLDERLSIVESELSGNGTLMQSQIHKEIIRRITGPVVLGMGVVSFFAGVLELYTLSFTSIPLLGISLFSIATWRRISRTIEMSAYEML